MVASLLRPFQAIFALLRRTAQLYLSNLPLFMRIGACLVVPSTLILICSGLVPTLYPTLATVQNAFVQSFVAVALVQAIAFIARGQRITVAGAYRAGLFRYGVLAVAGGLIGFLLLLPILLLLNSLLSPTTFRLLVPLGMLSILRLLAIVCLITVYCIASFVLFPVAVLNRGGPGKVIGGVFTLVLRYGWFALALFLVITLITTLLTTVPEYVVRQAWTAVVHPVLPFGTTSRWIEWIVFIVIQQTLLLLTAPIQAIASTIWYLEVRISEV